MPARKAVPIVPLRVLGGEDFKQLFRLKDKNQLPVDMTGWTLEAGWLSTTTGVYFDFVVTVDNPASGEFYLAMSKDKTRQMNNYGNYDVLRTIDGVTGLLFEGPVEYDKVITRG